jgi:hypothetical protein
MGFRISQVVTSAAVASAGTIAFNFPAGTTMGHFNLNTSAHKLYVEGHNSQYNFLDDFTISFATAAATVTYNGSTPIPANTRVLLMLEMSGQNDQRQLLDGAEINGYPGQVNSVSAAIAGGSTTQPIGVRSPILIARYGSPSTISTTKSSSATTAVLVTTLVTLGTRVVNDVARALQIVSSNADTTQTITIRGYDMYGAAMSEAITANGTTPVFGKKAFKEVVSYQAIASPSRATCRSATPRSSASPGSSLAQPMYSRRSRTVPWRLRAPSWPACRSSRPALRATPAAPGRPTPPSTARSPLSWR